MSPNERIAFVQKTFADALLETLRELVDISESRLKTLVQLVFLMMKYGTVCLWRLAAYLESIIKVDSIRRRFYRFFQLVQLSCVIFAKVIIKMLGLHGQSWHLAIDRTNWKFGKTHVNILVISVIWNGVGIPLIWKVLPAAGNSDTETRICLLQELFEAFPGLKIASLTGDREFVGDEWFRWLLVRRIPFVLRVRKNQYVVRNGYETWSIEDIAKSLKKGETIILRNVHIGLDKDIDKKMSVHLVIHRLDTGELLAVATPARANKALDTYKKRWTIETLFGNLKTRGFDMEATHMTAPDKISMLLGLLALGVAAAAKTGIMADHLKPIKIKKHGRKAVSIFSYGLTSLRRIFVSVHNHNACEFLKSLFAPFRPRISPKTLKNLQLSGGI